MAVSRHFWSRFRARKSLQSDRSEKVDIADPKEPRSEQYGLFPIHTHEPSLSRTEEQVLYPVDIIAVHGLGGDAFRTWTHADGTMWLRSIANDLPGVRVYTFGYDTGVLFSRATGTLQDFARSLSEHVRLIRRPHEVIRLVLRSSGYIVDQVSGKATSIGFRLPWCWRSSRETGITI